MWCNVSSLKGREKNPESPSCLAEGVFCGFISFSLLCCSFFPVCSHFASPHWADEGLSCHTTHQELGPFSWERQWLGRGSNCSCQWYKHWQKRDFSSKPPIKAQRAAVRSYSGGIPLRHVAEKLMLKVVKWGIELPLALLWALGCTGWPLEPLLRQAFLWVHAVFLQETGNYVFNWE